MHSSFSLAVAVYQRAAAQAGAEAGQVDAGQDNHGLGVLRNRTHRNFLFFSFPLRHTRCLEKLEKHVRLFATLNLLHTSAHRHATHLQYLRLDLSSNFVLSC